MVIQARAAGRNKENLFGWKDWPPSESESYPGGPGWKEPGTSREAALAIAPEAKTIRAAVLRHVANAFPRAFTADQVAAELNFSILTVRPRISELHKAALIERVAERRKNQSGMSAACWRATRDGIAEASA
jgi:hypothetical protein